MHVEFCVCSVRPSVRRRVEACLLTYPLSGAHGVDDFLGRNALHDADGRHDQLDAERRVLHRLDDRYVGRLQPTTTQP